MGGLWCRVDIKVYLGFILIEVGTKLILERLYFLILSCILSRYLFVDSKSINCGTVLRSLPDNIVTTDAECFQNRVLF